MLEKVKVTQHESKPVEIKTKKTCAALKGKLALEALKGVKTVQQIAAEYQIHPVQVSDWKKAPLEGAGGIFAGPRDRQETGMSDEEKERLHAKIGELTLHADFLEKA